MDVRDTWTRLERELRGIEGASGQLARGATEDMLLATEEKLRIKFPPAFRESYQIHDGTEGDLFIIGPYRLWPLSFIVEENLRNKSNNREDSETLDEADDSGLIRGCIFSMGWTTFGDDGGASQLAIDFDPGARGTTGQIIALYEDGTEHVAISFDSFLADIVKNIESGALEWNEIAGQYWPSD
jgi:cell wall assembly regulator SMI1